NQERYRIPSKLEYYGCGTLQFLYYGANIALGLWLLVFSMNWIFSATGMLDIYYRTVVLGTAMFTVSLALPFVAKWGLIGRWKEERFTVWRLAYFRFWVVRQYIQINPMAAFAGTPIYNMYLRMLGAKIGRNVVIMPVSGPICTDLIEIGDNTILNRDTVLKGYRAEGGYIQTGRISIGKNAYVGEGSVLDIDTVMQDDTELAHASSLQSGQVIPKQKRYHGSPAEEASSNFSKMEAKHCSTARKFAYCAYLFFGPVFVLSPLLWIAIMHLLPFLFGEGDALSRFSTMIGDAWASIALYLPIVVLGLLVLSISLGLVLAAALTRIGNLFIEEGKTYVRYGLHYIIAQFIYRASNVKFYQHLFGDSSYVIDYLKWIGLDLSTVFQTGSNFGLGQKQDNPLLCKIGSSTMVSDSLKMMNTRFSTTSFKLSRAMIGDRNYLGNTVFYPTGGRTGDNCLLATKVMIPIDGPVRENTGLLGSPCFEIPRMALRDQKIVAEIDEDQRLADLKRKNSHNIQSMGLWLFLSWLYVLLGAYLALASLMYYGEYGFASLAVGVALGFVLTIGYYTGNEWLSLGFKRLQPLMCTIYDGRYWYVERHWKLTDLSPLRYLFAGTPFRNVLARLRGTKVGKRVFDDGYYMSERTLVEIGDYCTLNELITLQCHSLEEGVFKLDRIEIGKGSTVGINAFVHYGTTLGDNAIVAPDSFLMKGETVESDQYWMGNPARAV
ncbi:MAG: Pls/PosA family non-ribosomal peptide synthetase, partial [Geminicoccaceae bacterium]